MNAQFIKINNNVKLMTFKTSVSYLFLYVGKSFIIYIVTLNQLLSPARSSLFTDLDPVVWIGLPWVSITGNKYINTGHMLCFYTAARIILMLFGEFVQHHCYVLTIFFEWFRSVNWMCQYSNVCSFSAIKKINKQSVFKCL